ncbi:MAG: hypothetical protein IK062_05865 [Selenomonadaceae bacterium]|nr:hypothetical protein [Selenomonadaceae bacterium]
MFVYRVVIIETRKGMAAAINDVLKTSQNFKVVAIYDDMRAALGQSGIYNPSLFLVDVENEEFLRRLPELVEIFPKQTVLCTMSEWNTDISAEVIDSGATGCILKPPRSPDKIIEAINLYKMRGATGPARTIAFFSPKGRSGRTTLASLMALSIAKKTNCAVALIDADLQFGDLPLFFDAEPSHTVVDAVHDSKALTPMRLAPYYHKITDNVWLLASPERPEYAELVDAEGLLDVIKMSENLFKYILIDLPANFNPISIGVTNYANLNFVISMLNTGAEISHVRRSMEIFNMKKTPNSKFFPMFTRVVPCDSVTKLQIEMKLGFQVVAIFPSEYTLVSMANSGNIVNGLAQNTVMTRTIDDLAEKIIRREI